MGETKKPNTVGEKIPTVCASTLAVELGFCLDKKVTSKQLQT